MPSATLALIMSKMPGATTKRRSWSAQRKAGLDMAHPLPRRERAAWCASVPRSSVELNPMPAETIGGRDGPRASADHAAHQERAALTMARTWPPRRDATLSKPVIAIMTIRVMIMTYSNRSEEHTSEL